jgi:pilus assembly protein CpaD
MNARNLSALIALGLSVAACGSENHGLESVHQPVVSRADYALDVNTSGSGLEGNDAARLAGWFDALKLGYGDRVSVDLGGNYNDGAAKAAISSIAARYGLLLQDTPPVTSGDVAPGSARVVVTRVKASVPSCPNWKSNPFTSLTNSTSSNYGCATNTNLAAMIANPEDLVLGQAGSGINDPASTAKSVKVFRDGSPTGGGALKSESVGGGK